MSTRAEISELMSASWLLRFWRGGKAGAVYTKRKGRGKKVFIRSRGADTIRKIQIQILCGRKLHATNYKKGGVSYAVATIQPK